MRIADGGVDIPDELIAAQERGGVVFLCGAGVSQRVGLPSFDGLVRRVYGRLGETWHGHPAEAEAMGLEGGRATALDRALFALAKRLGGHDQIARARSDRAIIDAVSAELAAPGVELPDHCNIVRLSRDAEMQSRVVTTNFDTLFERAWPVGVAQSRAGADLPAPQTADFAGVLHLHGRIDDNGLNLTRTPLVLNSAEFGEAYLRSGWAARYVYDLARATTIVIVGYGADDPPMRYILEVLTADRERYPDLKAIYAFAPSGPDALARTQTTAIWDAKGAVAIPYNSVRPDDHDALYDALAAWADFADDPAAWRHAQAARVLALEPDTVGEDDWALLRWILSSGSASSLLADLNPAPHWAGPLARAELLGGERASPAGWILGRMTDPAMPHSILDGVPIDQRTIAMIEHGLTWRNPADSPLPAHLTKAWRLILALADRPRHHRNTRWHAAIRALASGDASLPIRRELVACLRPTARPERPFRWPGVEREVDAPPRLRDVIGVRFDPAPLHHLSDFATHLPAGLRARTIQALAAMLDDALEDAIEYERPQGPSADVRSIARHAQDSHPDGFYPIVRVIIDLWELLAADDPATAISLAAPWRRADQLLLRRMWLHTLSATVHGGDTLSEGIAGITDEDFWVNHARREVMRLLAERWDDVPPAARAAVEERIVAGIPHALLDIDEGDQRRGYIDNEIFKRLERIRGAGWQLSGVGEQGLAAICARHPAWAPGAGDRDDFGIWSSGVVMTRGPQGDLSLLEGVGPERLIARATEIAREDPMHQSDVWRTLCGADPLRALEALLSELDAGRAEAGAWRDMLWAAAASDDPAVQAAMAAALRRDDFPTNLAHPTLDWLMRRRTLAGVAGQDLLALWDRLFVELTAAGEPVTDDMRDDPVFRMLNESEGKIGTLLLEEVGRLQTDRDENPLPGATRERMERLIAATGALGHLGRASLMDGLRWLHSVEAEWTEANLAPCLAWRDQVSAAACWAVALSGHIPPASLYTLLKPDMLEAAQRPAVGRDSRNLAGWLLAPLLWRQVGDGNAYDISSIEVRQALARGDEDLRRSAALWLVGAMEQLEGGGAAAWRERVGPLVVEIWPLEPELRGAGTSEHLARLALLAGDAFAEAVGALVPIIGPIGQWEVAMWLEFGPEGFHRFDQHPEAMLRLLEALVDQRATPGELSAMLERISAALPAIVTTPTYRKLLGWARGAAA